MINRGNGFRVNWDLTIKISDFGLARALTEGKDYYRITQGKVGLPIRWVALEGFTKGIFTTKSDIVSQLECKLDLLYNKFVSIQWSYGITFLGSDDNGDDSISWCWRR